MHVDVKLHREENNQKKKLTKNKKPAEKSKVSETTKHSQKKFQRVFQAGLGVLVVVVGGVEM